jgi:hypothetical protein
MPYDGDPDHPIVDRPWEFDIELFSYHNNPVEERHSYIDLTLRRGKTVRRLRFLGPQDLQIESDAWRVPCPDGTELKPDGGPFFREGEVSWNHPESLPSREIAAAAVWSRLSGACG